MKTSFAFMLNFLFLILISLFSLFSFTNIVSREEAATIAEAAASVVTTTPAAPNKIEATSQAAPKESAIDCYQRRPYLQLTLKWAENSGLKMIVASAEGVEGLPLYNGVVSDSMLPIFSQQKMDLINWPRVVEIRWSAQQCKKHPKNPWVISCNGPGTASREYDGYPLPEWPFSTSMLNSYLSQQIGVDSQGTESLFEDYEMTWSIDSQGTTYFLGFKFLKSQCVERKSK